ncbi:MAG TPA: dTMP kinase [Acidimicrobiia bacterium]|nr:dTMP kinase [Acidimicrobiia bacterium]
MSDRGRFVVLEGGEASGKSTQARLLAHHWRAAGRRVDLTFEPGATPLGKDLRRLLLDTADPVDPLAELLLLVADRAEHVARVVRPALDAGVDVVCDRYVPSSLVYQGLVRGVGLEVVERVNAGFPRPDVVVVLDVSDAVAVARRGVPSDRIEREGEEFHARVRAGYRTLASERGWLVVDGDGAPDDVARRVAQVVEANLAR